MSKGIYENESSLFLCFTVSESTKSTSKCNG